MFVGESTTAGGWSTARSRCWVSVLSSLINDMQRSSARMVNSGIKRHGWALPPLEPRTLAGPSWCTAVELLIIMDLAYTVHVAAPAAPVTGGHTNLGQ